MGGIRHVNPASERLFGRTADELRGRPIDAILPAELHDRTGAFLASLLEHRKLTGVFRHILPDGSVVPVEFSAEIVPSPGGDPSWILASVRDLSAQFDQLEHLNASALTLLAAPGDDLLVTIVRIARRLIGTRYAALGVIEDDRLVRFIPDGMSEAEIAGIDHWPEGRGLLGAMITERRTIRVAEMGGDPRRSGFPPGHPPMRSFLGTPIRTADEVYGHLYFTEKLGATEFSFLDERTAELFASHAAIAIRDRRRREELDAGQRSLTESQRVAHLGSGEWDLATGRMRWSEEALHLFGVTAERIARINDYLAIVDPDDRRRVRAALRSTLRSGAPYAVRHRLIRGDGEVRVVETRAEIIRDEAATPTRIIGTFQDITELARLEEGLRRSERNLAQAQRIAHIGSWERDLRTGAIHWSDEVYSIIGVDRDAFDGTVAGLLTFVHPDDRAKALTDVASLEEAAGSMTEYRIIRPDGAVRILHEDIEITRDEAGTPIGLLGTTQDLTERVVAERELSRLAAAVEQAADSIWIHDLDGTILYVNPSFSRLYGYAAEEAVGRFMGIFDSGAHDAAFWAALLASVVAGQTWAGSVVNRCKDGSLVEVDKVISPVYDADGRLTALVQSDRDVTRGRALEGALERNARERQTMEAALEKIDPGAPPEEIAAAACAEIAELPGVDTAWAIGLGPDHGRILAEAGRFARVFPPGTVLPEPWAGYLRERATGGPWAEEWRARPDPGAYGETVSATGLRSTAYAPLRGAHGVVGVIGIGVHDAGAAERLVEYLPALVTFGRIVGTLLAPGLEARHREDDVRASVAAMLDASAFSPFFQPIVEFHTGTVVGYEALTRFADGTPPNAVFALAERTGLGIELEMATLAVALDAAAVLPSEAYLSANVSPEFVLSGKLGELLAGQARPIVLEITEHVVVDDYAALRHELETLGPKIRLAVDDAGAGYASFRHILELAPDFVKLDIGLVRGIDADPARQALIAGMSYFAAKRQIRLIAEGVETEAEFEMVRSLAVSHGQGYLLGRPQDGRGPGPWPTTIALPPFDASRSRRPDRSR